MSIYHVFEIILVSAIVGACSVSVAKRYAPGLREWLHLGPGSDGDAQTDAKCGNSGCNGCSTGKQSQH
jgi:hypothetical protein